MVNLHDGGSSMIMFDAFASGNQNTVCVLRFRGRVYVIIITQVLLATQLCWIDNVYVYYTYV